MAKLGRPTYADLQKRITELEDENRLIKHVVRRLLRSFTGISDVMSGAAQDLEIAVRYVQ